MNKFQLKLVVILLAPLLGVAALGYQDILARSIPPVVESSVQRSVIDQPLNWEPFSADVKRIHERDGGTFFGRQYRSSDGSTRSETGRSLESIDVIGIKNIPESTYYNWTPETGWTSQPMLLPPQGWKPFERSYSGRTIDVNRTGFLGDLISWEDGVYGTVKSVFPGGARARRPDGRGAPGGPRVGVGGAAVGGTEARVHGRDTAQVGAAGPA